MQTLEPNKVKTITNVIKLIPIETSHVKDGMNVIWDGKVINIDYVFRHLSSIHFSELSILVCEYDQLNYFIQDNDYHYIIQHNLVNKIVEFNINTFKHTIELKRYEDTDSLAVFDKLYVDELNLAETRRLRKLNIALGNGGNNVIKNRYGKTGIIISNWDEVFDHIEKISNYRYNIDQRELFKIQFETGK